MKAFDIACRMAWAITEDALQTILEIAARENLTPAAVAEKMGRPLDNTHTVSVRDGVATIPVSGPIVRYASLFTEVSGATSIDTLATDLRSALDDPGVKAILLDVDSPGGAVNGVSEFAHMIHDARGQKPITAYVSDMGCSAAYWIASACDDIVVADTAAVGSIGVIAAMRDPKSTSSKSIEFVSSQSPNKRPDPSTEKGRAQIQTMVDDLASVFVEAVARNRGVDTDTVLSDFGQGGVFVGQKAVDAGLADRVGSFEGTLAGLVAQTSPGMMSLIGQIDGATVGVGSGTSAVPFSPPSGISIEEAFGDWAPYIANGSHGTFRVPFDPTTGTRGVSADADAPDIGASAPVHPQEFHVDDNTKTAEAQASAPKAPAASAPAIDAAEFEAMKAQIAALAADLDDARAQALIEAEKRSALERSNARRDLAALTTGWHGDADRHVSLMEGLTVENRAFYVETMNALSAQVETGSLFATAGVTGAETTGSAIEQLQGQAKALAAEKGMSYSDALGQIAKANPDMYAAYRQELISAH